MKIGMISISLAVLNLLGCSDVKFRSTPQNELIANCTANDVSATVGNRCVLGNDLRIGSVDILFINDNSGSMSFEQKRMSESFNSLISTLDGQNIDYNIAVTTTDISTTNNPADDENGNGALQDGKFIQFPNGEYILRKSNTTSSQRVQYFGSVIEREETKTCEDSGFTTCPSGDERGIYALNKVLDRADSSFFQSNLFAVVILSDEDERSDGGRSNSVARQLEEMDQPESVVSRLGTSLGLDKSMTVYSFIVQPGDYTCKSQQDAQGVALGNNSIEGNYGVQYGLLSNPSDELKSLGNIIEGKTISICGDNSSSTPDFGSELDDIGRRISVDSLNVQLPCEPELPEVGLEEGFDPIEILVTTPGGVELTDLGYTVDENNILRFTDIIEAGSEIQYSIVCKRITSL
tara:strand:- start:2360 stop:3577 length:1218 start_codon:yes stop_codon:yes gene_type:complete